jgi:hypothetical protein
VTDQDLYESVFALLLINDLQEKELVEGNFSVQVDECWASMSMLEATAAVARPTKDRVVEVAVELIEQAGCPEDEIQPITLLLQFSDTELEFADA